MVMVMVGNGWPWIAMVPGEIALTPPPPIPAPVAPDPAAAPAPSDGQPPQGQRRWCAVAPQPRPKGEAETVAGTADLNKLDAMFNDAASVVVQHQSGSTSLIQRKLRLGYNRAGRIIDQLEAAGVVGGFEGSKARKVLIKDEIELTELLKNLNNEL